MKLNIELEGADPKFLQRLHSFIQEGEFHQDYKIEEALDSEQHDVKELKRKQHIETLISAIVDAEEKNMRYDLAEILMEKIGLSR